MKRLILLLAVKDASELIRACALSGSESAWCELVLRFRKPVGLAIIRVVRNWDAVPQEMVDDLVQETFLKLAADKCARLYAFAQEHPEAVDLYVKTIAANVARDYLKKDVSLKRGSGHVVQLPDTVEAKADLSSAGGMKAIEQEILLRKVDECLEDNLEGATKARDRSIFWLYHRRGLTAGSIAQIPALGLTVKGVESVLFRLTRLVRSKLANPSVPRPDAPGQREVSAPRSRSEREGRLSVHPVWNI
jgi:RNA polymerase sigma-70 factor (ECF subfamily)